MAENEQELGIEDLETQKRDAERELIEMLFSRSRKLAFLLCALFIILALTSGFVIYIYERKIPVLFGSVSNLLDFFYSVFGVKTGTAGLLLVSFTVWLLPLAISATYYYFLIAPRIRGIRGHVEDIAEKLLLKKLASSQSRRLYLQEELQKLANMTARVFFDNHERYEQAVRWHKDAGVLLDKGTQADLNEAQFLLNSINELVLREEREQQEQRNWEYFAVLIMILYIVGLVVPVVLTDAATSNQEIRIFSIPVSVVMWGAAGSLAAILYRFYTEKGRIHFASEVHWLIARPIIGIIMGAVVYLALRSGLLLIGGTPSTTTQGSALDGRSEVYWVLAFLAGFSDKFYIGVINLLVEKTIKGKDSQTEEADAKAGSKKENDSGKAPKDPDAAERS